MVDTAKSVVLASFKDHSNAIEGMEGVFGPSSNFHDAEYVLTSYKSLGFQATHFAQACEITQRMFELQPPSKKFLIQDGEFIEELEEYSPDQPDGPPLCYPKVFLGMCANLLGTGCREALRFIVQEGIQQRTADPNPADLLMGGQGGLGGSKQLRRFTYKELKEKTGHSERDGGSEREQPPCYSFLSALVVSGGGMEHDLRRACEAYCITEYVSAERKGGMQSGDAIHSRGRFGNVLYGMPSSPSLEASEQETQDGCDAEPKENSLFDVLMRKLIAALLARQEIIQKEMDPSETISSPDYRTCAIAPSELWALAGYWLEDLMEDALLEVSERQCGADAGPLEVSRSELREEAVRRARSTVLYWAALQEVRIFSPSLSDGDIMDYILEAAGGDPSALLRVDLVTDLSRINRLASLSKSSGMIICGGGLIKHHVANANLMRNGADYAVIFSNSQEFDGSDAGARPDEAVSWGKIRIDGSSTKVYGEVTTLFPLLVAQVFLPLVRRERERGAHGTPE